MEQLVSRQLGSVTGTQIEVDNSLLMPV
jgi:hypothetical protein